MADSRLPFHPKQFIGMAVGILFLLSTAGAPSQSGPPVAIPPVVAARAAIASPSAPPLVIALYYGWYGLKEVSGEDSHIEKPDPRAHTIANFSHYPESGPYDSTDDKTLQRHLQQMKNAGIQAVAVSWWGAGDLSDKTLRKLLPLAKLAGLKVCVYVEKVNHPKSKSKVIDEITGLIKSFGQDDAYLKIGGVPVLFFYSGVQDQVGKETWAQILIALPAVGSKIIAIGEGIGDREAMIFDGIHLNNPAVGIGLQEQRATLKEMTEDIREARHEKVAKSVVEAARKHKRIAVVSVSPGFDDKAAGPEGLVVDREEGQFYRKSWAAALAAKPDWILVRSFNQWHDGTEIEPSKEFGNQYLTLTAEYSARFKQQTVQSK